MDLVVKFLDGLHELVFYACSLLDVEIWLRQVRERGGGS